MIRPQRGADHLRPKTKVGDTVQLFLRCGSPGACALPGDDEVIEWVTDCCICLQCFLIKSPSLIF
jgi:hypothetical protein